MYELTDGQTALKNLNAIARATEKDRWRGIEAYERQCNPAGNALRDLLLALKDDRELSEFQIEAAYTRCVYGTDGTGEQVFDKEDALNYVIYSAEGLFPADVVRRIVMRAVVQHGQGTACEVDEGEIARDQLRAYEADIRSDYGQWLKLGIPAIDSHFEGGRGIPAGSIISLVGAQGSGKTSLILSVLERYCAEGGRAIFFSLDMPKQAVIDKLFMRRLNVRRNELYNMIRRNDIRYTEAAADVERLLERLVITDTPQTPEGIYRAITSAKCDLYALDYVSALRTDNPQDMTRPRTQKQTIDRMMDCAKFFRGARVTSLLISQMSRTSKTDARGGGVGGHGYGSSEIENCADIELELRTDAPDANDTTGKDKRLITITKNRYDTGQGKTYQVYAQYPSGKYLERADEVEVIKERKPLFKIRRDWL